MMRKDLKHRNDFKCKFHNSGYCKFGDKCMKRHFSSVCELLNCSQECNARHPRLCKLEKRCKFNKMGICAYKHPENEETITAGLNKEIENLKNEVKELTENIEIKKEQLDKVVNETSQMSQKLLKEKSDMEKYLKEVKEAHAKAMKTKDMEIKTIMEENCYLKKEIIEMRSRFNSSLKEKTKMSYYKNEIVSAKIEEDNVLKGDFKCDKCDFSTADLSILVKHKANEHKPIMSCDQCKFKSIKKSDLQLHSLMKHGGRIL